MSAPTVRLGYELGSGEPVDIPVLNLVVTGQTQQSGKTTTLEALVERSGLRAIAFVTKRGEASFTTGRRIQPYFRDRADWQFVDQLLEAQLGEKNKFLRQWIIKICRHTQTLADVHREVKKALTKAKGINEGAYTQLDAYLELIVPAISRARLADRIQLEAGLNVMDVSGYPTPMQMLFVRSAIEWVNDRERDVVVIIPEAWEFIPETKGSPVKAAAVDLVRKGSALRNHIWVDSQDTAGVDKVVLRGCPVWLLGVQREPNEIRRNLASIPANVKRPSAGEIATLGLGQFYACFQDRTVKVYVQPAWLDEKNARAIAEGKPHVNVSTLRPAPAPRPIQEDPAMCEEHAKLSKEVEQLKGKLAEAARALIQGGAAAGEKLKAMMVERDQARSRAAAADRLVDALAQLGAGGGGAVDVDGIVEKVLARIPAGAGGAVLQVTPPEKLRHDFQEAEVRRLLEAVAALSPLAQSQLLLLESIAGSAVGQQQLASRLGRSWGGNARVTFVRALEELTALGLIEVKEREGVRTALRVKIETDLGFYNATPADVEATHQNVLARLATGKDR
jgi:hypothetical protein